MESPADCIRRTRSFRLLLPLIVLLSGCITIEEHYSFNEDGSGTMEFVVDMTAFKDIAEAFGDLSDPKHSTAGAVEAEDDKPEMGMQEKAEALQQIQGIRDLKQVEEEDGYIQRIRFAFADLHALNSALNVLMPDSIGKDVEFFRWEGRELVRRNNNYTMELGEDMAGDMADDNDISELFASMKYKMSFTFAKPVTGTQVADGIEVEAPDDRTLELSTDWSVLEKDPTALDLRIKLGK